MSENYEGSNGSERREGAKHDKRREGGYRGERKGDSRREGGYRGGQGGRGGDRKEGGRREGGFHGKRDGERRGGFKRDGDRRERREGDFRGKRDGERFERREGGYRGKHAGEGRDGFRAGRDGERRSDFKRDGERRGGFKRDGERGEHGERREGYRGERCEGGFRGKREGERFQKRERVEEQRLDAVEQASENMPPVPASEGDTRSAEERFDHAGDERREGGYRDERRGHGERREGYHGERCEGGFRGKRDGERRERDDRPRGDRGDREDRNGREGHSDRGDRKGERRPRGGKAHRGPSAGRKAAYEILSMLRERDAFARDLLSKHVDASSMSREDRAFATRLVLGVVSACGTLDEMLDKCMDSPDDVQPDVRDALRISTYEMLFLDKGAYAVVNEGVELVRSFAPSAARLANAVLRKVSNQLEEFPFGDAEREVEAFARKHAFPKWMAMLLLRDLGMDAARDFVVASNEPAPLFIAVNAAKATPEEVLPILEVSKGAPEPAEVDGQVTPGCYRLADARALVDGPVRPLLEEGKIIVSDAAAQTVAHLILPEEKPASFLEIGAGRGTKTVLLQSQALGKYGSQIENYVTLDNLAFKTKVLADRAEQCGIRVDEALTGDALNLSETLSDRAFDAVFVDAPCSGLGTLRRHPEIRWRLQEEDIASMAKQGLEMLKQAAAHVAPGGTLAYATCTVTHEENNSVVRGFLESPEGADFSLAPLRGKGCFATRLVSGGCDGHFAVRFVRNK